jgi:hypothetical protein
MLILHCKNGSGVLIENVPEVLGKFYVDPRRDYASDFLQI